MTDIYKKHKRLFQDYRNNLCVLIKLNIVAFIIASFFISCASLKPYERIYVDDSEMQMGTMSSKKLEHYVQSIREGAVSIGSKKGNGGCGCN